MPPPARAGEFGHGVALRIGVAHVEVLDGPEDVEKVFMGKRGRIEPFERRRRKVQHGELVSPVRHGEIDEAAVLGAPGDRRIAVVDQPVGVLVEVLCAVIVGADIGAFGSECDAVRHIRIERVIAAAQLLVGELRFADVVEQTAVLPVAGGMVVPLRDNVGRVIPVDGRHGPSTVAAMSAHPAPSSCSRTMKSMFSFIIGLLGRQCLMPSCPAASPSRPFAAFAAAFAMACGSRPLSLCPRSVDACSLRADSNWRSACHFRPA